MLKQKKAMSVLLDRHRFFNLFYPVLLADLDFDII